jgi:hypothetical protein
VLTQLFVWANIVMDGVEIAALGTALVVLFHMRRDLSAMLRVLILLSHKIRYHVFVLVSDSKMWYFV